VVKVAAPAKTAKSAKSARAAKPAKAATPAKTAKPAKAAKPARAATPATAVKRTAKPTAAAEPGTTRKGASEFKNFEPYTLKKGEEYMNEAQKDHFRAILRNWRAELMTEVDRTVTHMKDEAANFPDPADRATQEEEFSLELRTRDRERKLIKKIESTLDLIDQNDYGFCDACGVDIGIKRLEARPTATLCIDCKTLEEIKERQERG
jgi:DnaK suppressor protein